MKKNLFLLSLPIAMGLGAVAMFLFDNARIKKERANGLRLDKYYRVLNYWLSVKISGRGLEEYFTENNYKKIAIYGLGELGRRVYEELWDTSIEVKYGIDKDAATATLGLDIVAIDDYLDDVDVIVVTPLFDYENIKKDLLKRIECDIVSLEDVICDLV